jgi:SecD/SecF fusion protein
MALTFSGGRSYVVRFDQNVNTVEMRSALAAQFGEAPEVKTFGPNNQVKDHHNLFMIDDDSSVADSLAERKLFEGYQMNFLQHPLTFEEFVSDDDEKVLGRMSSRRLVLRWLLISNVGAVISVIVALIIIFLYIAARFKKWQFGVGGLLHSSMTPSLLFHSIHMLVQYCAMDNGN